MRIKNNSAFGKMIAKDDRYETIGRNLQETRKYCERTDAMRRKLNKARVLPVINSRAR